ncbi:hypothetical protein [Nocardia inohanensis]|uniref:hypothetical protein n=1 Tax=Nocardia inohanensis TaxID=209246 RepID=UPI000832BC78|nr:hypothetical protein [Nocardia inohanensis]
MGIQPPATPARRAAALLFSAVLPLTPVLLGAAPALAESPAEESVLTQPDTSATQNVIRIGKIQADRPDWITPEQAAEINAATTGAESTLARTLESTGLDAARSDQIAAAILADAAIGAAVGATAAAPIASTGALIGVVSGVVAGLAFAPVGLVIVPVAGAALGYAMVAAPFAAAGAAVGAAVGAVEGALTPSATS